MNKDSKGPERLSNIVKTHRTRLPVQCSFWPVQPTDPGEDAKGKEVPRYEAPSHHRLPCPLSPPGWLTPELLISQALLVG